MLPRLASQGMFGWWENERKWKKIEVEERKWKLGQIISKIDQKIPKLGLQFVLYTSSHLGHVATS